MTTLKACGRAGWLLACSQIFILQWDCGKLHCYVSYAVFFFSVPTLLFLEKTVGKVKWVVRLPLRGDPLYFSDGRTTHFTLAWRIPLLSVDNALFISYWAWALPSRPNYISIGDFYLSIHVLGRRCCCLIAVFCFNFYPNLADIISSALALTQSSHNTATTVIIISSFSGILPLLRSLMP